MTKKTNIKEHYSKWLNNEDAVKKLKADIVRVGYPLESSVRNILKQKGYDVSNTFYEQPNQNSNENILREIDIYATKTVSRFIYGCLVNFRLTIIGDCKYSATNDFFVFESVGKKLDAFPIFYNLKNIFSSIADKIDLNTYFRFPLFVENISEVNVDDNNFHPSNLVIYDGALQIINAVAYFQKKYFDEIISVRYRSIHKKIIQAQSKFNLSDKIEVQKFIVDYLMKDFGREIEEVEITIAIPLIVIGENSGFIHVKLEGGKVIDFVDIGYGLYLFVPSVISNYLASIMGDSNTFPIAIANLSVLHQCIDTIEKGFYRLLDQIDEPRFLFPYHLYSNVEQTVAADPLSPPEDSTT